MADPIQPVWVIVSTSEESKSGENVMSFIKSLVNKNPNVKVGFDWKSSGNDYPEDIRKWKMINPLLEDLFKKNGKVDEEVYRDIEEQVLRTEWWKNYRGQIMGRLKQAASDHPSETVKAICIEGGPISRVEERQMHKIVKDVGGEYGSSKKPRIDVCNWDLDRFKDESDELRNQSLNQAQKEQPKAASKQQPKQVPPKQIPKAAPKQEQPKAASKQQPKQEWLLAPGAEQHFENVFGTSLESFVNGSGVRSGNLGLDGKCNTEEKRKAVARVLAANVKIDGWNGKLDLRSNQIVNIDTIGKALETNKSLEKLYLGYNRIVNIDAIGKALETNKTLNEFNLYGNNIVNVDTIGKALETNTSLNWLNLSGNQIVNIDAIGKALETNNTLKSLDLAKNQIVNANNQKIKSIWNNRGDLCI